MKILFLIAGLQSGGAERAICNLASYLSRHGFDAEIQYVFHKEVFYSPAPEVKLTYKPLLKFLRPAALFLALYWKLFPRKKPDVIISFLWTMNYFSAALAKFTDIPVIISERNNPKLNPGPPILFKRFYKYVSSVSKIVTLSEGAAAQIQKMFNLSPDKICIIHNPINNVTSSDGTFHKKLPDHFMLAVGRFYPQKGYPRMLRIFAAVRRCFPQEKLVICGDGPMRSEIEKQIMELELEDSVILAGICKNIDVYYRNADAMLFTSLFEGQPNVVLEAQTCGCPVIAFDCDYGPSYLIQNGKTGLVIPDGDEAAMTDAVINYLKHPEMRDMFQKNMPEHLKQFAPEKIYQQWIDLIKEVTEYDKII